MSENAGCLWTVEDLVAGVGGRLDGEPAGVISAISMDSRAIAPGEAFFAIRGETFDGHSFVADALARGAALAVVADDFERGAASGALVRVDDPLEAMRRLGRAARARSKAKITAITGSVGKTGTKHALARALGASGPCHASPASYNNHWGVPFTLSNLPREAAFGVFEIGMNHAGEITPLTNLVRPHVAIITTVAAVHLEYFPSVEAIADAKAEIFAGLEPDGVAVLNRDNEHFARLERAARAKGARVVSFGTGEDCDIRLVRRLAHEGGSVVDAVVLGDPVTYKLGAPGLHLVMNSLAVLGAVRLVGADLALGALALADWQPAAGRGARLVLEVGGGEVALIDESYNANPASMRAALAVLGDTQPVLRGRRIAVLGDMLELGDSASAEHIALGEPINAAKVDLVFACGPMMRDLFDTIAPETRGEWRETSCELEEAVANALRPGDLVMVKGSNGSRLGPLIAALTRRFGSTGTQKDQLKNV